VFLGSVERACAARNGGQGVLGLFGAEVANVTSEPSSRFVTQAPNPCIVGRAFGEAVPPGLQNTPAAYHSTNMYFFGGRLRLATGARAALPKPLPRALYGRVFSLRGGAFRAGDGARCAVDDAVAEKAGAVAATVLQNIDVSLAHEPSLSHVGQQGPRRRVWSQCVSRCFV
jgi:hypothetical protein